MNKRLATVVFYFILLLHGFALGQNVVIDGARYSETFGAKDRYIPKIWNEMRPQGTIYMNFRNNRNTVTIPGNASIVTGTWQKIDNRGLQRPFQPTIFEYFRKATGAPEKSTAIVAGRSKLNILTHSTSAGYGVVYKASFSIGKNDRSIVNILKKVLVLNHPRITLVHLPDVDSCGHSGNWKNYVSAISTTDSLVYEIWQLLESDSVYYGNTTMFVLSDHGRHDKSHGDFKNHGDACEGCRHIMLLAIGRGFPPGRSVAKERTLCDIAPTISELLSFPTKQSEGTSLLRDTVAQY